MREPPYTSQPHKKTEEQWIFFVHILLIDLIQYSFSGFNLDGMDDDGKGPCTYISRLPFKEKDIYTFVLDDDDDGL